MNSIAGSRIITLTAPIVFQKTSQSSQCFFSVVRSAFNGQLTTFFGNQEDALARVYKEKNRLCEVAVSGDIPVGFFVSKLERVDGALVVPNLVILDSYSISEVGEALVDRLIQVAQDSFADKIEVTIPNNATDLLNLLNTRNFQVLKTSKISETGMTKSLLSFNLPEIKAGSSTRRVALKSGQVEREVEKSTGKRPREYNEEGEVRDGHGVKANQAAIPRITTSDETKEDLLPKRIAVGSRDDARPRDDSATRLGYYRDERRDERDSRDYDRDNHLKASTYVRAPTPFAVSSSCPSSQGFRSENEPRRGIPIRRPGTSTSAFTSNSRGELSGDRREEGNRQGLTGARVENHLSSSRSTHRVPLMRKYLEQIKSGRKTVEGRINSGQFLRYKPGDIVTFFCQGGEVTCRITNVVRHSSFRDMLTVEGVQKCLADVTNLEQGARIYDAIPGYSEKAARFGVLAIHVELLK